jgi:hypothetical protein
MKYPAIKSWRPGFVAVLLAGMIFAGNAAARGLGRDGGMPLAPACGAPGGAAQIDTLNSPGGSLTNGFGTWTFGPIITPPTAAGPPGPFGPYRFIKLNGKVINNLSSASAITLDCADPAGGTGLNVFFLTTQNDRWWYQYTGYNFGLFVGGNTIPPYFDPASVQYSPGSPTTFSPPYTPTPGTISGSGTLTSDDGIWTLSSGTVSLNGRAMASPPPGGPATDLTVSATGQLFAKAGGTWQVWLDFNWYAAGSTVPAGPIPIRVTVTVASPYYPGYAVAQNLATGVTTLTTAGPPGTGVIVATIAVTMSNGGAFSGSLSVLCNDGTGCGLGSNILLVNGSTLYLANPPAVSFAFYHVSASQNGVTTDAGPSVIEVSVSS